MSILITMTESRLDDNLKLIGRIVAGDAYAHRTTVPTVADVVEVLLVIYRALKKSSMPHGYECRFEDITHTLERGNYVLRFECEDKNVQKKIITEVCDLITAQGIRIEPMSNHIGFVLFDELLEKEAR